MRLRARRVLLFTIVILYALSIPWYRSVDQAPSQILGMPDWVAVATGCYVAVAVLNCLAWLLTPIEDPPASEARK